jgi:hypothetical protein
MNIDIQGKAVSLRRINLSADQEVANNKFWKIILKKFGCFVF